jgi:RNA polymerase sigma-70 factor, ECF subfamily
MRNTGQQQLTQLLLAWSDGDEMALEKLTPIVYSELHRLAQRYMRGERPGHLLQATALINEAYLKLIDWKDVHWKNRAHFVGVCAKLMRRILVDFARSRDYAKRGGGSLKVSLDQVMGIADERGTDLVVLDDALKGLAKIDPRKCEIVEMRFFGGLSVEETAAALNISVRTVLREWSLAQAWLLMEFKQGSKHESRALETD